MTRVLFGPTETSEEAGAVFQPGPDLPAAGGTAEPARSAYKGAPAAGPTGAMLR